MILKDLKEMFDRINDDVVLKFGLTGVFSWRGSYDEVAFSIGPNISAKQCKELIQQAYEDTFYGYKGGEYNYTDYTEVNFEAQSGAYSDGEYTEDFIALIEDKDSEYDRDTYLVSLMLGGE